MEKLEEAWRRSMEKRRGKEAWRYRRRMEKRHGGIEGVWRRGMVGR